MHRDHFFPLPITPTRECHQGCCASTRELSVSISPSLATSCCCRSVAAHGGADQAHVLSAQRWQQWEELVWILSVLSWKDADAYLNPDQGVLLIPLSMRPGLCYFPLSISPTAIQTVLLFLRADLGGCSPFLRNGSTHTYTNPPSQEYCLVLFFFLGNSFCVYTSNGRNQV